MSEDLKGCGSHSCIVKKPEGMGTNGPCRCADWRGQRYINQLRARLADTKRQLREAEKNRDASRYASRKTMEHKFAIERRIEEVALEFAKDYPDIESCNATQMLYAIEQTLRGLTDANDDVHAALREAQERADKAEDEVARLRNTFTRLRAEKLEYWMERCERLEGAFLLIEHGDGCDWRGARITAYTTEAERDAATVVSILGHGADVKECEHELAEIRESGWVRFEGDPPLQWIDAALTPEPDEMTQAMQEGKL